MSGFLNLTNSSLKQRLVIGKTWNGAGQEILEIN